jgi:tight adherence protein B
VSLTLSLLAGCTAAVLLAGPLPARLDPPRWGARPAVLGVLAVPACVVVSAGPWLVPALVLAGAMIGGRLLWRRRAHARRTSEMAARVVEVCDLLAAELAAGRPPPAALDEAVQAAPELRAVAEAAHLGGDVAAALRVVAAGPGADGLRLLAGAWSVSHRTGAGLAESTRRVAEAVRADQETCRVVAGELSSARATARLVAFLPAVALLMGSGAGSDPWYFLLRTPWGLGCLTAGLALGLAGLWWIEVIAREASR